VCPPSGTLSGDGEFSILPNSIAKQADRVTARPQLSFCAACCAGELPCCAEQYASCSSSSGITGRLVEFPFESPACATPAGRQPSTNFSCPCVASAEDWPSLARYVHNEPPVPHFYLAVVAAAAPGIQLLVMVFAIAGSPPRMLASFQLHGTRASRRSKLRRDWRLRCLARAPAPSK
jgi:hypothetical protein